VHDSVDGDGDAAGRTMTGTRCREASESRSTSHRCEMLLKMHQLYNHSELQGVAGR
jgi:hypothetical protein